MGEVWAVKQDIILRSDGIGSCIAVAAYDAKNRIGSLSHIMLPGKSLNSKFGYNTKYAYDAIEDMLFKMIRLGADKSSIEACLVGGGNVLKDEFDTICGKIIDSVISLLEGKGIRIIIKVVVGTVRRSVVFHITDGIAYYTEDDSGLKLLYNWGS